MPEAQHPLRSVIVSYRLTAEEAGRIDAAAAAMKPRRTRADWARAAALHVAKAKVPGPVRPSRRRARRRPGADVEALARILGQLGKLGSNINQIARIANTTREIPTANLLAGASAEINAFRRAVEAALGGRHGD